MFDEMITNLREGFFLLATFDHVMVDLNMRNKKTKTISLFFLLKKPDEGSSLDRKLT